MQKISDSTSTANAAGEFTSGSASAGVAATLITPEWLNALQRELVAILGAVGAKTDATKDSQVLAALGLLFAAKSHTHGWSSLTNVPSTVAGYGIADAVTKSELSNAIANAVGQLVNGAPGALDQLNELATALGNDPNFATTMLNGLAQKADAATTVRTRSDQRPSLCAPSAGESFDLSALEIREAQRVGAAQAADAYAPSITFHWLDRVAGKLSMKASGQLYWGANRVLTTGDVDVASEADMYSNVDNRYVTPAKARQGLGALFNANAGFFRLPGWLGGLQIAWGKVTNSGSGTSYTFAASFSEVYGIHTSEDGAATEQVETLQAYKLTGTGFMAAGAYSNGSGWTASNIPGWYFAYGK